MIRKYAFDTTLKIIPHLFCVCVSIANTYEAIAIPVLFMVWFGVLMPPPPLLLNGSILMFTFCFSFSLFVHFSTVYFEVFAFFS